MKVADTFTHIHNNNIVANRLASQLQFVLELGTKTTTTYTHRITLTDICKITR